MRFLNWTLRLVVFLVLVAFAAKNTEPVTLHFYFDLAWQAPLVVLLLAFFTGGAVLGLLAMLTTLLRQRREILQLRRDARRRGAAEGSVASPGPELPPVVDG
ncbi:MAG TPA: LapA family protein [Burkholderiales bacterium]|nr:LapA family protein [Burkholderiales bacterium]